MPIVKHGFASQVCKAKRHMPYYPCVLGNVFLWERLAKASPNLPAAFLGDFLPPAPAAVTVATAPEPPGDKTAGRRSRRSRRRANATIERCWH